MFARHSCLTSARATRWQNIMGKTIEPVRTFRNFCPQFILANRNEEAAALSDHRDEHPVCSANSKFHGEVGPSVFFFCQCYFEHGLFAKSSYVRGPYIDKPDVDSNSTWIWLSYRRNFNKERTDRCWSVDRNGKTCTDVIHSSEERLGIENS